jgi:hypothetical protein
MTLFQGGRYAPDEQVSVGKGEFSKAAIEKEVSAMTQSFDSLAPEMHILFPSDFEPGA